tara:strand:- start:547 stop:804 length:258 start_codon:yes stop_codon:yes gene_type:complete
MKRKPNFIDKLPNDKKGHLILGLLINPIVFAVLNKHNFYALILCLLVHAFIEIHQYLTKTGEAEIYDFLAGSYSAIVIYILTLII